MDFGGGKPNAASPAAWDMSSSTIQNVSTIWVKDNNFLRIKNVELAYTLSEKLANRINIANLRVFVSAFNLGFIHNSVRLYDPESRSDTGWYLPSAKNYLNRFIAYPLKTYMMKSRYAFLLIFTLITSSCNDILDLEPLDSVSDAAVWSDPALLELYVNSRYDELPHGYVAAGRGLRTTSLTDESYDIHQGQVVEPIHPRPSNTNQYAPLRRFLDQTIPQLGTSIYFP